MKYRAVKGMHDVLPDESPYFSYVEDIARRVFERHGFKEIRTPVLEHAPVFIKSLGEASDVVSKEMYRFIDKDGSDLVLRPEGTAAVVRALVEHALLLKYPEGRFYYSGPMFRRERPQAGRYRQFHQVGVEYFGDPSPFADAEIIYMAYEFLNELGLRNFVLLINTVGCEKDREKIVSFIKDTLSEEIERLCPSCREKLEKNPLRVLDCKEPGCKEAFKKIPPMRELVCDDCRKHYEDVLSLIENMGIEYRESPSLVRGLDYYTGVVFEFHHEDLGLTILAGGRYDKLVESFGGQPTPAVGFAGGVERIVLSLQRENIQVPSRFSVYIVTLSSGSGGNSSMRDAFGKYALKVAKLLWDNDIPTVPDIRDTSFKAKLRRASKGGYPWVVIIGQEEFETGKVSLKNMKTGEQRLVSFGELIEFLKSAT